MAATYVFSIDIPRVGGQIDIVEWGGSRVRTSGELTEVDVRGGGS